MGEAAEQRNQRNRLDHDEEHDEEFQRLFEHLCCAEEIQANKILKATTYGRNIIVGRAFSSKANIVSTREEASNGDSATGHR
jgi:hypothetical protein